MSHYVSICKSTGSYNVSYYGNCILKVTDVVRVYGKIYYDLPDTELYEKLKEMSYKKCNFKDYQNHFCKSLSYTSGRIRKTIDRLNK
jgi:hypothetical protein